MFMRIIIAITERLIDRPNLAVHGPALWASIISIADPDTEPPAVEVSIGEGAGLMAIVHL